MNVKFCFLAIFLLALMVSCSSVKRASAQKEVVFDDGYKSSIANEVVIDDRTFQGKENTSAVLGKSSPETSRTLKDGSQINVMSDNFGNKTETRTFNNTLLKFVLLRTSADGNRQVFVYGQNGEVKSLPENMLNKVLTASSNELASSAGIYENFKQAPSLARNAQMLNTTPLRPLPSSQFPIQNQQVEKVQSEIAEPLTDKDNKTLEKSETVITSKKPDKP